MQRLTLFILFACTPSFLAANTVVHKKYVPGEGYVEVKRVTDGKAQKTFTENKIKTVKEKVQPQRQVTQPAPKHVATKEIQKASESIQQNQRYVATPDELYEDAKAFLGDKPLIQAVEVETVSAPAIKETHQVYAVEEIQPLPKAPTPDEVYAFEVNVPDRMPAEFGPETFNKIPLPVKERPYSEPSPAFRSLVQNEPSMDVEDAFPMQSFDEARAEAQMQLNERVATYEVAAAEPVTEAPWMVNDTVCPKSMQHEDDTSMQVEPVQSSYCKTDSMKDQKRPMMIMRKKDDIDLQGWFMDASEGVMIKPQQKTGVSLRNLGPVTLKEKWHPGLLGSLRFGYKGRGFKGDLELGYYRNVLDLLRVASAGSYSVTDVFVRNQGLMAMLNATYDILESGRHTLSVGLGVGYLETWKHLKAVITDNNTSTVDRLNVRQQNSRIACQALAHYNIRITPDVELMARYRFLSYKRSRQKARDAITREYRETSTYLHGGELGLRIWF